MTIGDHTTDPVASALSELEPGTRALLDLSLRRALPDQELAKLVAADPVEIGARRERALDGIATRAGIDGPGARDQVTARLLGVPAEVWLAAPAAGQPAAAPPPARRSASSVGRAASTAGRSAATGREHPDQGRPADGRHLVRPEPGAAPCRR